MKLIAQLNSKDGSRSRAPLVTAVLEFDADYARIYAERLAESEEAAKKWLAEHAEHILLEKCFITFKLEHSS